MTAPAPDPYRSSPAGWVVTGAALAVLLVAAFACTPPEDRTAPAPGPTVTAPEGDAGGTWGGETP